MVLRTGFLSILLTLLNGSCQFPLHGQRSGSNPKPGIYARIETEKGSCTVCLFYEQAPLTCANFIGLAEGTVPNDIKKTGEPYFDGLKFYRVIRNKTLSAGCPKNDGTGHPGYYFTDEFADGLDHRKPGMVSMESASANLNGSRFVINMVSSPEMDERYPVFGEVISGLDTLGFLQQGDRILHVRIIRTGKKAAEFSVNDVFKLHGFDHKLKYDGK